MTQVEQLCFDLVRTHDRDRFLTSLFAPEEKRQQLLALYAFNVEICRIPDLVSEPQIGEIRLQWWLDTLAAIYEGNAQDHPVAQSLASAIAAASLPKAPLENLVKAHIFDLYADPMPTMNDLEGYLGETQSALIQMAALILAGPSAQTCSEASGLAGVAYGIAKILQNQDRQSKFIPLGTANGRDALVAKALARLSEARQKQSTIPPAALPAFLPVSLTPHVLCSSAKNKKLGPWRSQWLLWKAARAERF